MQKQKCQGFLAGAVAAGIKKKERLDLGLIYSAQPASVAGVFTQNRVKAAPVQICQDKIKNGTCRAIVVNSGNANCFTGKQGMIDANAMCTQVADSLKIDVGQVLVASTGVIGQPLPMDRIQAGITRLNQNLSADGFDDLAKAIMTTDTVPKLFSRQGEINGSPFNIVGVTKGAGMIHPDMATMLAFICTDARIDADLLQSMLLKGVNRTLNRISIDGDTSTNDTALFMANGASNVAIQTDKEIDYFQTCLDELLMDLAKALVKDGEGVTKLVEIRVQNAATAKEALLAANTVATSPLVKTAFFGEDANWGRLLMAIGRSGAQFDPDKVKIYFDDVLMVADGSGCGLQAEKEATAVLKKSEYAVIIELDTGTACESVFTGDLSVDYIHINADYRS